MKKFLITILLFIGIPLLLLVGVYVITDPYRTLRKFSLEYFDDTNRDYLSSELWLTNYPEQKYDSYIFGSSRGSGINTYHWQKYLPEGSRQFLFQGWSESLTGIEQKITYIDKQGYPLRNVIVLIDYTGTFTNKQQPTEALSMKHPLFSGQPKIVHEAILFYDFVQKPSQWVRAIKHMGYKPTVEFDPVTNDWQWNGENKFRDLSVPPEKDSLKYCSETTKTAFLKKQSGKTDKDLPTSKPVIDEGFRLQLTRIAEIFRRQGTDYRIIITPGYCYTDPKINDADLETLQQVFGAERVYDYSGKNYITEDYNNYSDPSHFDLWSGWHMIEDIYGRN